MSWRPLRWHAIVPETRRPETRRAGEPESRRAGEPESRRAGEPESRRAGEPESRRAGEPESRLQQLGFDSTLSVIHPLGRREQGSCRHRLEKSQLDGGVRYPPVMTAYDVADRQEVPEAPL